MAKEALFNILNNQFDFFSASVLDLFSGTGNISYEFSSRECELVTSVDQNKSCIKFIQQTKEQLKMENLEVVQADCFGFVQSTWKKYDIIFADPPYDMPDYERLVNIIFEKQLLNPDGMLIVEHSKNTKLGHLPNYDNTRNYGSVHFSFFEAGE